MKAKRQMRIVELVSQNVITSQEAICEALAREGIRVTQATVSRDIKELNLVRAPSGDGRYKYSLMPGDPTLVYRERFRRLFTDCCVDMNRSGSIILVKTLSGTASAVGEAIDALKLAGVLGTVAGDNAVLVVVREGNSPQEMLESLRKIAGL
jgi:transcriptional regulator of arginine metabolism